MNRRNVLSLSVIMAFGLALLPGSVVSAKSLRRGLPLSLRLLPNCGIAATDATGHVWTAPS